MRSRLNPEGTTPIDPDEAEGLIPLHIRTQSELDAWEQSNIIEGLAWAERQGRPAFSWGRHLLTSASEIRDEYLAALRRADQRDYLPLFRFARSNEI